MAGILNTPSDHEHFFALDLPVTQMGPDGKGLGPDGRGALLGTTGSAGHSGTAVHSFSLPPTRFGPRYWITIAIVQEGLLCCVVSPRFGPVAKRPFNGCSGGDAHQICRDVAPSKGVSQRQPTKARTPGGIEPGGVVELAEFYAT
jgi:hypothetical protein